MLAPSPMPSFPFDRYIRYDELTQLLKALADARPDLVQLDSIGKSQEGRDIWCVTVTNFATGPANEKPGLYIDGNIHATEVSPTTACTYLLQKLVRGYGIDETITRALDTRAFYVIPRVSPDGAELFLSNSPRAIRSSTRPYPFDEVAIEGLQRGDVNGDGLLLQMRIPDANGPWKKHPDDPRLMVRRNPTETGGAYYRLLPEGRITHFDGVTIRAAKNREGLDLNRNFPAFWEPEHQQIGAGPYPASEPESRALIAFLTSHKNVCGTITFHTYDGVILRPYDARPDDVFPAEDLWVYETIGKKGTELTGYPAISCYRDFRDDPKEISNGVFDDWCYDHLGVFAWTVEIWSPHRQAGITEGFDASTQPGDFRFTTWARDHTHDDDLKMLRWADECLQGKGFYDWCPFEHPDLGRIEIGGWDVLFVYRNPPPAFLEAEIAPLSDWLIWQALCSPKLAFYGDPDVLRLSSDTYKIRIAVQNTGWLPTYVTQKALERQAVRPLIAEIVLPEGATLVQGKSREEVGQLEGRAYKPAGNTGFNADITDDRAKVEWIVRSTTPAASVSVTIRHERAGTVRAIIPLEAK